MDVYVTKHAHDLAVQIEGWADVLTTATANGDAAAALTAADEIGPLTIRLASILLGRLASV